MKLYVLASLYIQVITKQKLALLQFVWFIWWIIPDAAELPIYMSIVKGIFLCQQKKPFDIIVLKITFWKFIWKGKFQISRFQEERVIWCTATIIDHFLKWECGHFAYR